jgi:two-component system response regulator PilR (NtrC family)
LFEAADGGTLFLDEIGELPPQMQVKLLRAIQEKSVRRVGGNEDIQVDARIIAATNRDLSQDVQTGRFREDLFYRLNVIQLRIPPLRERKSDVPMLAEFFLEKHSKALGKDVRAISEEAMQALRSYDYPGNVRELENIVERAVALETSSAVLLQSLPAHVAESAPSGPAGVAQLDTWELPPEGIDLEAVLGTLEQRILEQALERAQHVKKDAAKLLGISFRSIRYRLSKYKMEEGDDEPDTGS